MVGPGQTYRTIASAVAASHNGDEIDVQAGTYTNDFAEVSTQISMSAVGGRVVMQAQGQVANGKGILITDTDVTITGFTFTGAQVSNANGGNGAGLRYQGGNLVLNQCWFKNNQDGLLADADPTGTIRINRSEFSNNGAVTGIGAGYTHNMYIGAIALVDIENSYVHHANLGHEIKAALRRRPSTTRGSSMDRMPRPATASTCRTAVQPPSPAPRSSKGPIRRIP